MSLKATGAGASQEPTLHCPNCNHEIKLTESLAAPLLEETRQRFNEQLAAKDAEVVVRQRIVNQRLIPADKGGPFGPGAVGVSAFSNVLTGWAQGGPIAIHGTNAPWSIGKAVSNGCIRIPNAALKKLFDEALNGTPVLIRP